MDWRDPISKLVMVIGGLLAIFSIGVFSLSDWISNTLHGLNEWNIINIDTITSADVESYALLFIGVGFAVFICGVVIKLKYGRS